MKKIIPFLIILFISGFYANAQLVILDKTNTDITNDTITVNGTVEDNYFKVQIYFSNTGEENVEVFVRKHELNMVDGADNSFCWNGTCFSPSVFDVEDPIVLGSEQTSVAEDFYTEFFTGNVAGVSQVMYEFYDDSDSFETVTITIIFDIAVASNIAGFEASDKWKLHEARPNPARDHTWIDYNLPVGAQNAQIVVRNLLGNQVYTENLSIGSERARINTSGLSNGIYIYSLVIDNQVVQSKRLVVAN